MPLVIAALAPGFVGHPTLQLAVNDARLMLPYLAFAGPATVIMALMSAQHRFALTAFSPLLFNIALISVMIALLGWRCALRGDDRVAIAQAESRGLELALGLALPATLGLIVLSEPVA